MTIINNEYKQATLNKNTPVKIRVRGNASAYGPKKSYKIAFEEPKDMLGLGEEYADKEWILLGKRDLFKTYFGIELSKAVGMEWEPRMRFVNLILNGDWKGLYILCESIKRHPKRVDVDEDGFLIESDGYYWKEKAPVFRSPLLSEKVGFTFKYPKVTSDSDDRFLEIKKHFQEIDKAVENMSDNLGDLIDFETFAAWALVHEIMGTKDGFGSNMFFYQKSIGQKTKLKMGPAWDFDSVLPKSNFKPASFWYTKGTYLSFLQEHPKFREYYKTKYSEIASSIEQTMREVVEKLKNDNELAAEQIKVLVEAGYDVSRLDGGKKLVLITGHRRENFGEGFISMVTAMKDLSEKYPDVDFVYPMHLNPNVRKPIHEVFGEDLTVYKNFFFIEPLQYLEFVYLMEKSTVVLTDSGGIQEEAPGLGKPVLVMRDTTERPEALESGTVHLVGTNHDLIVNEVSTLLDDPAAYDKMSKAVNPYGDGKACGRIVEALR